MTGIQYLSYNTADMQNIQLFEYAASNGYITDYEGFTPGPTTYSSMAFSQYTDGVYFGTAEDGTNQVLITEAASSDFQISSLDLQNMFGADYSPEDVQVIQNGQNFSSGSGNSGVSTQSITVNPNGWSAAQSSSSSIPAHSGTVVDPGQIDSLTTESSAFAFNQYWSSSEELNTMIGAEASTLSQEEFQSSMITAMDYDVSFQSAGISGAEAWSSMASSMGVDSDHLTYAMVSSAIQCKDASSSAGVLTNLGNNDSDTTIAVCNYLTDTNQLGEAVAQLDISTQENLIDSYREGFVELDKMMGEEETASTYSGNFGSLFSGFDAVVNAIGTESLAQMESIMEAVPESVKDTLASAGDKLSQLEKDTWSTVSGVVSSVMGGLENIGASVSQIGSQLAEIAQTAIDNGGFGFEDLGGSLEALGDAVGINSVSDIAETAVAVGLGVGLSAVCPVAGMANTVMGAVEVIGGFLGFDIDMPTLDDLVDYIGDLMRGYDDDAAEEMGEYGGKLSGGWNDSTGHHSGEEGHNVGGEMGSATGTGGGFNGPDGPTGL